MESENRGVAECGETVASPHTKEEKMLRTAQKEFLDRARNH